MEECARRSFRVDWMVWSPSNDPPSTEMGSPKGQRDHGVELDVLGGLELWDGSSHIRSKWLCLLFDSNLLTPFSFEFQNDGCQAGSISGAPHIKFSTFSLLLERHYIIEGLSRDSTTITIPRHANAENL